MSDGAGDSHAAFAYPTGSYSFAGSGGSAAHADEGPSNVPESVIVYPPSGVGWCEWKELRQIVLHLQVSKTAPFETRHLLTALQ